MGHDGAVTGDLHSPVAVDAAHLVVGVGASRGCPAEELSGLVDACLAETGLSREAVVAVASADVKSDEPAILALAAALGVPARFVPAPALAAVAVPTPSPVVARHVGTPSVAEAAALLVAGDQHAAAGPDAPAAAAPEHRPPSPAPVTAPRLVVQKRRSAHATCAIAVRPVRRPAPEAPTEVPAP